MDKKRGNAGFTLAELLIVVAIIGVLVSVAIPVFATSTKRAEETVCLSNRTSLTHQLIVEQMTGREFTTDELRRRATEIGITCPIGGAYTVNKGDGLQVAVTCKEHGETQGGGETPEESPNHRWSGQIRADYITLISGITGTRSNDAMRKKLFDTVYADGCPKLLVDGQEYDIQPYYSGNAPAGTDLEDRVWVFAKTGTANTWNVPCVFDPIDKVWYWALSYDGKHYAYSTATITSPTAEELHNDILNGKQNGGTGKPKWERIPEGKYQEIAASVSQG